MNPQEPPSAFTPTPLPEAEANPPPSCLPGQRPGSHLQAPAAGEAAAAVCPQPAAAVDTALAAGWLPAQGRQGMEATGEDDRADSDTPMNPQEPTSIFAAAPLLEAEVDAGEAAIRSSRCGVGRAWSWRPVEKGVIEAKLPFTGFASAAVLSRSG